jgi:hypothetical protein
MDYELIRKVLSAFEAAGVKYVVFGAAALNLHGLPRFTEDLDVFIAPDEENIKRLRQALHAVFDDPHIEEITADDLLGEYTTIQYVPPEGSFHIDILTKLGEVFRFDDLESQRIDFDGIPVTVVTPRMLYRMKRDTVRAKDRGDAEALKRRFHLEDE